MDLNDRLDKIEFDLKHHVSNNVLLSLIVIAIMGNIWAQYFYDKVKLNNNRLLYIVIATITIFVIAIILRRK